MDHSAGSPGLLLEALEVGSQIAQRVPLDCGCMLAKRLQVRHTSECVVAAPTQICDGRLVVLDRLRGRKRHACSSIEG